jgi:hypothetical protein
MNAEIDDLRVFLFAASDGRDACDAINALTKHAAKGSEDAKQALAAYARDGSIDHMRDFACSSLADVVTEADVEFVALFRHGMSDPELQYWSILGYINSAGKGAYEELAKIAADETLPLEVRGHAVKCLARSSKQPFDRRLPSDPGQWKGEDLRLAEIAAWMNSGSPEGQGHFQPTRHAALDEPKTAFEKIVGRLDKRLAKQRGRSQDLADPTDWLAIAAPADIQRIKARWELPAVYLDFLTRFSPVKVIIESREFYNGLQLFGASELIEAQDGYSFNPIEQQPIEDWPAHLVVVASHGGDPFVLDLSKSDGGDAPVDTAEHGAGVWKFDRVAGSFSAFLKTLAK